MSTLQFYVEDLLGNPQEILDPVESFEETDSHWIIDNDYSIYYVNKETYKGCKAFIRLTPADDNPLYRMESHLKAIRSSVEIDWNSGGV